MKAMSLHLVLALLDPESHSLIGEVLTDAVLPWHRPFHFGASITRWPFKRLGMHAPSLTLQVYNLAVAATNWALTKKPN